MLKTNVSHVHTIRKWPEDNNHSRYVRAFCMQIESIEAMLVVNRAFLLTLVMGFNDRINDWLSLFYCNYIATIKLIYRQPVYSLRINRKIETNRNGYNDCNGENRPNRHVYFFILKSA